MQHFSVGSVSMISKSSVAASATFKPKPLTVPNGVSTKQLIVGFSLGCLCLGSVLANVNDMSVSDLKNKLLPIALRIYDIASAIPQVLPVPRQTMSRSRLALMSKTYIERANVERHYPTSWLLQTSCALHMHCVMSHDAPQTSCILHFLSAVCRSVVIA